MLLCTKTEAGEKCFDTVQAGFMPGWPLTAWDLKLWRFPNKSLEDQGPTLLITVLL